MSEERFYVVKDSSGAIYGPANVGTLRIWIGEGRITPQMQVAVQGTADFREAWQLPELAGAFPDYPQPAAHPVAASEPVTEPTITDVSQPASTVPDPIETEAQPAEASLQPAEPALGQSASTSVADPLETPGATIPSTPQSAPTTGQTSTGYPQSHPQSYPQSYPQGYPQYQQKTSGMATASLVCGLLSFIACPAAIAGVILGHVARGQIRREPARYEGDGMALAGLVISYLVLIGWALLILFYIVIVLLVVASGP